MNPKCGAALLRCWRCGAGGCPAAWQTKRGSRPGLKRGRDSRGGRPGGRDWVAGSVDRRADVRHCTRCWRPLRPQSPAEPPVQTLDICRRRVLVLLQGFQVDSRCCPESSGVPLPPPPIPSRAAGAGVARVDGVMPLRQAPDRHIVSNTPEGALLISTPRPIESCHL